MEMDRILVCWHTYISQLASIDTDKFQSSSAEEDIDGGTSIEARPFKVPFYKASHSKGIKERALHVHQRKTKHFIAKLLAQPYRLLHTFSILVVTVWGAFNKYKRMKIGPFDPPSPLAHPSTTSIEKVYRSVKGCKKSFAMKCFVFL